MPDYRSLNLTPGAPALPPPAAVPLQAISANVVNDTIAALDTLPASGERVLGQFGLMGGHKFLIPNGENPASATRIYPDKSTPRVVLRLHHVYVTPGCFVGMEVGAIPSGPCQRLDLATFVPDGAGGTIQMEVVYTNGDAQTVTVTASIDFAPSQELYAAEPANAMHAITYKEVTAIPTVFQPSAANWQKWTRGGDVYADVTISYIGSPRVVDGIVTEHAFKIVVDQADSYWPAAMHTLGGEPYQSFPSAYPIEQRTASDPGGGFKAIRRALFAQGRELGPFLFGWTSATEHTLTLDDWIAYDAGSGDDECPWYTTSGTTPTQVPFGFTSESAERPGWTMASYARQVDHGDAFFDGRTGVLPVWVYARVKVSAGTGNFKLKTGIGPAWSEIHMTTTSTTATDLLYAGWLEVGTGPEDATTARLWQYNSGANNTFIRSLGCFFRPRTSF